MLSKHSECWQRHVIVALFNQSTNGRYEKKCVRGTFEFIIPVIVCFLHCRYFLVMFYFIFSKSSTGFQLLFGCESTF